MDKILLPISCKNYHINFNLNLKFPIVLTKLVNPTPVSPIIYGGLKIYRIPSPDEEKERGGGTFPLVKSYSFSQFSQTFPIKRITVKNFIANLPLIVSIFESIIFNNENPWVKFLPTPEHPEQPGNFMNLKTKEVSQRCPENIYPWVEYLETGGGGRHYYVSSLTGESSWTLPEVYEGDGEPYINTVLKEIIVCLKDIIENPQQTRMLIDESEKVYHEKKDKERKDKLMNKKITSVFVIDGHSFCSIEKIPIEDPNMCVMTLSKLGDLLVTSVSNIKLLSDINQIVKSQHSDIGSYVELAKRYRETKLLARPAKDEKQSIRVRCSKSTVSNQTFYGGTKTKTFEEGIFMFDAAQHLDISKTILTPSDMKNIYPETTEFQKKIIEFESHQPNITSIPLDVYKKHFESDEQFDLEFKNLQRQRRLFCTSLDYSKDTEEFDRDALMYRGIDVETLQHYYDFIVEWEKENKMFANEYFEETQDGLETFMDKFGISYKDEKDKINKNYLLNLSLQRMRQLNRRFEMLKEHNSRWKSPIDIVTSDYQEISSLYEPTSCRDILKNIQKLFPGDEKLVIFKGCRVISDERERDPYHSDNEGEFVDEGGSRKGKRRQHSTMKMKIKSTFKKNKKLTRTRIKNKNNKKSARNRIKNKNNKKLTRTRVRNNKKLTRTRVRKNKKYFY
jgi:hypothetical protein